MFPKYLRVLTSVSYPGLISVTSVLVCRFLLALRGIYYGPSPSDENSRSFVSIFFCSSFAGNIGAPLTADLDVHEVELELTDIPNGMV